MKLYTFMFVGVFAGLVSCSDHNIPENTCSVSNPIVDLPWLTTRIEDMKQWSLNNYFYIIQARHKSQTVFIFANCCPYCSSVFFVYDCQGNAIGTLGDDQFENDLARHGTVIWKADNSLCAF